MNKLFCRHLAGCMSILMLLSSLISACGGPEHFEGSIPKVVGGSAVPTNNDTAIIALLIRDGGLKGAGAVTRICTATRVAESLFLGAASCLDTLAQRPDALMLGVNSRKQTFKNIGVAKVHIHPDYNRVVQRSNIALVRLFAKTPDADANLGSTLLPLSLNLDFIKPAEKEELGVAGYGCESMDADLHCTSAPTAFKNLKTLSVKVDQAPGKLGGEIFSTFSAAGSMADGDIGGPVFARDDGQMRLVGVHSHLAINAQKQTMNVHTWLGDTKIKGFLKEVLETPGPQGDPFQQQLNATLENIYWQLKSCGYDVSSEPLIARFNDHPNNVIVMGKCSDDPTARAVRIRSLRLALSTAEMADLAYREGSKDDAYALLELASGIAKMAIDIGLGFTPIGPVKDITEAILGQEVLPDFQELTHLERGVLLVSGLSGPMGKAGKLFFEWGKRSASLGKLIAKLNPLIDWGKDLANRSDKLFSDIAGSARAKIVQMMKGVKSVLGNGDEFIDELTDLLKHTSPDQVESLAKVLSKTGLSSKLSPAAKTYIKNQLKNSAYILGKTGEEFSEEQMERMLKRYIDIESRITKAPVTKIDEIVWRAIPREVKTADGSVIINTEESVFAFHAGVRGANHRYSAPGDSALYASLGEKTEAWETVFEELQEDANKDLIIASKKFTLDKVLDLTDPEMLKLLGLNIKDITAKNHRVDLNKYEITQIVGNLARVHGYKGIKVRSAATTNARSNLVILGD